MAGDKEPKLHPRHYHNTSLGASGMDEWEGDGHFHKTPVGKSGLATAKSHTHSTPRVIFGKMVLVSEGKNV